MNNTNGYISYSMNSIDKNKSQVIEIMLQYTKRHVAQSHDVVMTYRKYYKFSNRVRKITVRGTKTFAAYELLGISQILITCKITKIGRVL